MADLNALYEQYLGRAPDPSGIATWSGQDEASIIAGILGSQEYANRGGDSGGGGGSPAPVLDSSNPNAAVSQIYQSVLGRAPDASAQGWIDAIASGADPQAIAQQIANSQEGRNYAAANPSAQFAGLASLSQGTNPLAGTNSAFSNMQYVGPSFESAVSDERGYRFKDASGGIVTTNSAGEPIFYSPGQSWYEQQYAKNPNAIRTGYAGQQYLAAGPLEQTYNFNGKTIPISATEYQIDPQTRRLTQNPVVYEPSNDFTSWATSPMGALTLGAGLLGGAYGLTSLLGGAGAAGAGGLDAYMASSGLAPGAFEGAAFSLPSAATTGAAGTGLTAGSGYSGIGLNPAIQTGGELAYQGVGLNPAITGSSGVGLNATLPGITSGLATNAGALAAASGIPITAAQFGGYGALTAEQAYALDSAITAAEAAGLGSSFLPKGASALSSLLRQGAGSGLASSLGNFAKAKAAGSGYGMEIPGIVRTNTNPFFNTPQAPIQTPQKTEMSDLASLLRKG